MSGAAVPKSGAVVPGGSGPGTSGPRYLSVVGVDVVGTLSAFSQSQDGGQSGFEQSQSGAEVSAGFVVNWHSVHSGISGNSSHILHAKGTHSSLSSPSEQATGVVMVML